MKFWPIPNSSIHVSAGTYPNITAQISVYFDWKKQKQKKTLFRALENLC